MKNKLNEEIKVFNDETGEELDLQQILNDLDDEVEDNPFDKDFDDSELDLDSFSDLDSDDMEMGLDYSDDEIENEEISAGMDDTEMEMSDDTEMEMPMDDEEEQEQEDPDFQGMIRTVKGACLVYKRKTEEGDYKELWIYNIGKDIRQETQIRRAILAGTDIEPSRQQSEDGTQSATSISVGNVQFLEINGLPN